MNKFKAACGNCDYRYEENGDMYCGCKESPLAKAPFLGLEDGCRFTTDPAYEDEKLQEDTKAMRKFLTKKLMPRR